MTDTNTTTTETCDAQITITASPDCLQQFNNHNCTIYVQQQCGCCDGTGNSDCTCQGGSGNGDHDGLDCNGNPCPGGTPDNGGAPDNGGTPPTPRLEEYFYTTYSSEPYLNRFNSVAMDNDDNITVVGASSIGNDAVRLSVAKLNNLGGFIKDTDITISGAAYGKGETDIVYGSDGFYYISCPTLKGIVLVKLDDDLAVVDKTLLPSTDKNTIVTMRLDNDNNVYLAGNKAGQLPEQFPFILKFDSNLDLIERKEMQNDLQGYLVDFCIDDENIIFLLDQSEYVNKSSTLVFKTDNNLNVLAVNKIITPPESKTLLGSLNISKGNEGGYIVKGRTYYNETGFLKLDASLNYTEALAHTFTETSSDKTKPKVLKNGDLIFSVKGSLFRLNSQGAYKAYLKVQHGTLTETIEDSQGRVIVIGRGSAIVKPIIMALPNDLETSSQALAEIDLLSVAELDTNLLTGEFANETTTLSLVSATLDSQSEPDVTQNVPVSSFSLTPILM